MGTHRAYRISAAAGAVAVFVVLTAAATPEAKKAQAKDGTEGKGKEAEVDCEALGFTSLALCSDCDVMAEYVKDEGLVGECRSCCATESKSVSAKYHSAVIEVCKHRLRAYPHVQDFLEKKAEGFGSQLKVRHRFGAYPQLILKNEGGKTGETVRVDNWKVEHFQEFLADKLAQDNAAEII